ncbi:Biotin/lipoate A/B protein ligase [Physocladia obscura]|uniref:Putative lipoate-protein ligase A n=1 Tax=Physocladia obscura TaxID=109957 RepID=A0AAD5T4N8_9FUNG|nr:Biotin/lipoate A/B protein ligase [Physocladia obscura]
MSRLNQSTSLNQNPWKECNLPLMRSLKIPLIRRRSGGGTVVHNLGNTNYTAFMPRDSFSRDKSALIVANALHHLDIPASVNDISGMKVSGSAFKVVQERAYAHGTMLISSDLEQLGTLLKSPRKNSISGKGVESVPSKVTRLADHSFTVAHTDFCRAVAEEFGKVFNRSTGLKKVTLTITEGLITLVTAESNNLAMASSVGAALSTFFVGVPYDDGTAETWNLLTDINRWRMSISDADDVLEWIRNAIWSGFESN